MSVNDILNLSGVPSPTYSFGSIGSFRERPPILSSLTGDHSNSYNNLESAAQDHQSSKSSCRPRGIPLTTVEQFIKFLQSFELPGPLFVIGSRKYIGGGAQFTVYKQLVAWPNSEDFTADEVAVKQPNFFLHHEKKLDLGDRSASKHMADMELEIRVLMHPDLRRHSNIVKLVAWSLSSYNWHAPPVLLMELALGSLDELLRGRKPGEVEVYWICLDVGAGLDAIHDCQPAGLIHGDLKPQNVLIFQYDHRLVAKLADFGLSTDSAECKEGVVLGGTRGWQAPEVMAKQRLDAEALVAAENYAYGLMIWSVIAGEGTPLLIHGEDEPVARAISDLTSDRLDLCPLRREAYVSATRKLLQKDAMNRPKHIKGLLDDGSSAFIDWQNDVKELSTYIEFPTQISEAFDEWEVSPLPVEMLEGLSSRWLKSSEGFSGQLLYAMFLIYTTGRREQLKRDGGMIISLLLQSAKLGYELAQECLFPVFGFFQIGQTLDDNEISFMLKNAIQAGSRLAMTSLDLVNPALTLSAVSEFQRLGGYAPYYSGIPSALRQQWRQSESYESVPKVLMELGCTWLHWLVIYGSTEEIRKYFQERTATDLHMRTRNGLTPLILACMRGAADIFYALEDEGAGRGVFKSPWMSPMHWLFAFSPEVQSGVARTLMQNGVSLDTETDKALPFPFYPFLLMAGTPLHWAVRVQSHCTISTLVTLGADVLRRNGMDPYMYDVRVRALDNFGGQYGTTQYAYSKPTGKVLGFSPLDLAASMHDPHIFECIVANGCDMSNSDEEGLAPIHRLSTTDFAYTSRGIRFSQQPFRGSAELQREAVSNTIGAMVRCGAHVDQKTKIAASTMETKGPQHHTLAFSGVTALMLAMLNSDANVVEALLAHGADPNIKNDYGKTAVLFINPYGRLDTEDCLRCFSALADCGSNLNICVGDLSLLLLASSYAPLEVVELLLSRGVEVDVPMKDRSDNGSPGRNWLTFLSRVDPPTENLCDEMIVRILKQQIFVDCNVSLVRRLLNRGDAVGGSVLHYFVKHQLVHSVQALVEYGVSINTRQRFWMHRPEGSSRKFDRFYESTRTPLDVAKGQKELELSIVNKNAEKSHSNVDIAAFSGKFDAIIRCLLAAGARSANATPTFLGVCVCSKQQSCMKYYLNFD